MAQRDLLNNVLEKTLLSPAVYKVNKQSATLDTQGYYGAIVLIHAGAVTDGTYDFKLQESDDDSTYTDVAAANVQGTAIQLTTASGHHDIVFALGYMGGKRYVQVTGTVGGSPATGSLFGISGLLGFPRHKPTR